MVRLYELKEKLSLEELEQKINELGNKFRGREVLHEKSGARYLIGGVTIMNYGGTAYYGVVYFPIIDNTVHGTVPYSRPLYEFLDGRFTFTK